MHVMEHVMRIGKGQSWWTLSMKH